MDGIGNDVLAHVLEFVGPNNFLYVAPVNRRFRDVYKSIQTTTHSTNTSFEADVETLSFATAMVQVCRERQVINWDKNAAHAAAKRGRLNILRPLLATVRTRVWVTVADTAAKYGHMDILEWVRSERGTIFL